jgi:hypothetical protein
MWPGQQEKDIKENGKVIRSERYYGSLYRSLSLGQDVDQAAANAKYAATRKLAVQWRNLFSPTTSCFLFHQPPPSATKSAVVSWNRWARA